jgi:NTE family protein
VVAEDDGADLAACPARPATARHRLIISSLRWVFALALGAWLASAGAATAQEPAGTPTTRPKIGIAFSGGGAKGSAHIGVLKVLEEMHIPVDYAAGTSMGAIIGGLYASGLSPAELEDIMLEIDWADALIDRPSRHQLQFRRKNDDLHYISDLELGIGGDGLKYPLGLRSGQNINYLLTIITLPVRSVHDFDDLPIPFRAVATDIATGTPVVLDHGDLARAMRASMAIPTAFSPVELDGKLLVDGGVSNNIPVDVVRAMGADIVIAIDIGAPLLQAQQVRRSFLTILDQTLGLTTRGNMAARLEDADLVLTPEVGGFGTLDFGKVREIVDLGEAEARNRTSDLARLSIPEEEYAAWRASHKREPDPIPTIREVRVEGNSRVDTRIITPLIHARGCSRRFEPDIRTRRLRGGRSGARAEGGRHRSGLPGTREALGTRLPALRPGVRRRAAGR